MAFYGYNGDAYWSDSAHDYGAASHYSSPYHPGEPNPTPIPNPIDYYKDGYSVSTYSHPINYASSYDYYHCSVNQSETNYSQPKYLRYDPPPPGQGYFPSQTKFTVSYSNAELSVPEFEEYDPTPYDGGYDQAMTYGKPLPPSDYTCYPRSLPQSDAPPLENFSFDSIPSPYGRDDDIIPIKPPSGSKAADNKTEAGSQNGGKVIDDGKEVEIVEPSDAIPGGGYSSYEHQNGRGGDVTQIPYGSGLEAMDICESLFGYWPCLAKKAQQQRNYGCQVCDPEWRIDPWKSAADYLFGSPVPYDYDNYHHHHQSLYQSDQTSWQQ